MLSEEAIANGRKPARVTRSGQVFIGDDELPFPIAEGSIKAERANKSHCILTVGLIVGSVTMEAKDWPDDFCQAEQDGHTCSGRLGHHGPHVAFKSVQWDAGN